MKPYGERFKEGDVIGCAVDLHSGMVPEDFLELTFEGSIAYWKNGAFMGIAFTIDQVFMPRSNGLLFPAISAWNASATVCPIP